MENEYFKTAVLSKAVRVIPSKYKQQSNSVAYSADTATVFVSKERFRGFSSKWGCRTKN
jgi:hypothetical protein